ncbi:MAG TPA: RidA family protein [Bacteroidia bacterium]|nr:RidA family protein [Bacteroidia bacterium]
MKKIIKSENGPKPIGPYSHAVQAGNILFTSGMVGIDPKTNELVAGDIKAETRQAMLNLKSILETAGASMSNIVKATIFLKDLNNFTAMNEVYGSFFESGFPARETVQAVRLPKDANIEISVIAVLS